MTIKFYHNPQCSKSRAVKALLDAQTIPVTTIEYLTTPFTLSGLRELMRQLDGPAASLLRTNNEQFRKLDVDISQLDETQVAEILLQYPSLFQRPVVTYLDRARIGRPPEAILDIIS